MPSLITALSGPSEKLLPALDLSSTAPNDFDSGRDTHHLAPSASIISSLTMPSLITALSVPSEKLLPALDLPSAARGATFGGDANGLAVAGATAVEHRTAMGAPAAMCRVASCSMTTRIGMGRDFASFYAIGELLGTGMQGAVYRCTHRKTREEWAVKIVKVPRALGGAAAATSSPIEAVLSEAKLLASIRHPGIVHVEDVFKSAPGPDNRGGGGGGDQLFIVMELVTGGDLLDRLVERGRYPEMDARALARGLLEALAHLHERQIVHRDIKPENILLTSPHDDVTCKLTDFGLAKEDKGNALRTFCGTPQYVAPEVVSRKFTIAGEGRYSTAVDMWSFGVVLYVVLAGEFPFNEDDSGDGLADPAAAGSGAASGMAGGEYGTLHRRILDARFAVVDGVWEHISEEAKDLIRKLITTRTDGRLSASGALSHPWLTGKPLLPASPPAVAAGATPAAPPPLPPTA